MTHRLADKAEVEHLLDIAVVIAAGCAELRGAHQVGVLAGQADGLAAGGLIAETICLLIAPERTISTISTVALSVTRSPSTKST